MSQTNMDLGRCFVCTYALSLPTKLNVDCNCKIYGCLCCVRDYLKDFPVQECPICRKKVKNQNKSLSYRYTRMEQEWRNDDARKIEEREFDSTCRRCNAKMKNQQNAHKHLLEKCQEAQATCEYCHSQVKRKRLNVKNKDCHYIKNECPMKLCVQCRQLFTESEYEKHLVDELKKKTTKKMEVAETQFLSEVLCVRRRYSVYDTGSMKYKQDLAFLRKKQVEKFREIIKNYNRIIVVMTRKHHY